MQVNSNTIDLEKEDLENVTAAVKKIAEEHGIDNVRCAHIDLNSTRGMVRFEFAEKTEEAPAGQLPRPKGHGL